MILPGSLNLVRQKLASHPGFKQKPSVLTSINGPWHGTTHNEIIPLSL